LRIDPRLLDRPSHVVDERRVIELAPERLIDIARSGWFVSSCHSRPWRSASFQ